MNDFTFSGYAGAGEDGIDFFAPVGSQLSFDLFTDNVRSPDMIHIGSSGSNPPQAPFALETLSPSPIPPTDAPLEDLPFTGHPDYLAAHELGFFLWQDSFTNAWHLRWSGDTIKTYHFTGTIIANANFTAATTYSFESNDTMRANGTTISFSGYAGAGEDGLNFSVPEGSKIVFDLLIDGQRLPTLINIGATRSIPSQSPFSLDTTAVQQVPVADIIFIDHPTYTPAINAGYYLWQDQNNGTWHLRWSGDSIKTKFYSGTVTADADLTSATTYSFESNDTFQVDARKITFTGYAGAGEDGLEFVLPPGTQITFDLYVDHSQLPGMVHVGPVGTNPPQLPFSLKTVGYTENISPLGKPPYVSAHDAGYYLWQDADDKEWHLRWSGDSISSYFYNGSLICNAGITSVKKFSYESSDTLESGSTIVKFSGYAGAGEDGIDFWFLSRICG